LRELLARTLTFLVEIVRFAVKFGAVAAGNGTEFGNPFPQDIEASAIPENIEGAYDLR
jgi:hypothetical protein